MNLFRCDHSVGAMLRSYCIEGCHDWPDGPGTYLPRGADLYFELVEWWANNSELDPFHSKLTPYFEKGVWYHLDGLDEAVNEIMLRPGLLLPDREET